MWNGSIFNAPSDFIASSSLSQKAGWDVSPNVATPLANLTVYMYQEEHALFIFSVLEETVISEEYKRVKKKEHV